MANPIWITGQNQKLVDLGTVTEGSFFQYVLDSFDPNGGAVSYKFLAGELPPGIRIFSNVATSSGSIQGGPYLNTVSNQSEQYNFTVRATDQHGLVSDKSFAMTISNIKPPMITTPSNLGEVFDGTFFDVQLQADEFNPYAELTWFVLSGNLPPGITLTTGGLLTGFITPIPTNITPGTAGYYANTPFDEYPFSTAVQYQNNIFTFTVSVFDGANYSKQTYTLKVKAKSGFTADTTFISLDDTYLSVDHDNVYVPIMTTPSQALPEVRSNSKFAFLFEASDPNEQQLSFGLGTNAGLLAGFDQSSSQGFDTIGFDQQNLTVPPGLLLDPTTGWFSGTVGSQREALQTYTFQVYAYETNTPTLESVPITYTMNILGDIKNTITWNTGANLGIINNGTVSELSVSATNNAGKTLRYSLTENSNLPQGLSFNKEGLIVGRTAFEFFTLDLGATTVDGSANGYDNQYTFTVEAKTLDGTSSSTRSFTVLVNNIYNTPFEDVYICALPTLDQRQTFLNIVNNTDIFPSSVIYRESDPNFGRSNDIRSLFLAGLKPSEVSTYITAMQTNTFKKRIDFGSVKTAVALDADFNIKYEVVYIEIEKDYTYDVTSPISEYDKIIDKTVYNNSFTNMSAVISNATGYSYITALPDWMTSPQSNKQVLGFTRAIVLAYTTPGNSELVAYRLAASGIEFNNINFVADRYDLDNSYSANFDIETQRYDLGSETTFDRIIRTRTITASADYGISGLAFDQINNQTVSYVNNLGGLDGITNYQSGETLVFLQQENYSVAAGQYDGWTNNGILVNGYNEYQTSAVYSSSNILFPQNPQLGQVAYVSVNRDGKYDYYIYSSVLTSTLVSGDQYQTTSQNFWKLANLRANIWTINIDSNNIITLTPTTFYRRVITPKTLGFWAGTEANNVSSRTEYFVNSVDSVLVDSMIVPGDYVQINRGASHSDSIRFYNPALSLGQSVPAYSEIPTLLANSATSTSFDTFGTKFISNRVTYSAPEASDQWLYFPETGPLQ